MQYILTLNKTGLCFTYYHAFDAILIVDNARYINIAIGLDSCNNTFI